tara:strand:+ start:5629 stop:6630 length:1002 start_codon:yes stop_codon:yes gene_type:complete
MIIQNNFSNELKFLVNFLFNEDKVDNEEILNLNLENLIKIASRHLLLPALFFEINKRKITNLFPSKFTSYIQKIYNLNKQRNTQIKDELIIVNSILKKKEIQFVFLKGCAMLLRNSYEDIGIRMIGDIDILVDDKDYQECIEIFTRENYRPLIKESFINTRHYPRMVNEKKLCAVEVHNKLLSSNRIFIDYKKIFNRIVYCPFPVMDNSYMIQNCIYDYEVNDNGYIFCSINLKSFYDFKLLSPTELTFSDKYINSFLLKYRIITGIHISNINFYKIRFIMKMKFKIYSIIDNFFVDRFLKFNIFFEKLYLYFANKNYRMYLFNKILKFYGRE